MTKTIFITGASAGIGKATAKFFAAKGWKVIATMRKPENETELNLIDNITLMPLDVTNPEQIIETAEKALALGDVDVVFNNAGYAVLGALEATSDEQLVRQMDTNFIGTVRVTKAFIPNFRARKSGLFINTTSSAGLMAFPISSMYDASKWALEGWAESLSYELSQFGIGIKNIEPGLVATEEPKGRSFLPIPLMKKYQVSFLLLSAGRKPGCPAQQKLLRWFTKPLRMVKIPYVMCVVKMQKLFMHSALQLATKHLEKALSK